MFELVRTIPRSTVLDVVSHMHANIDLAKDVSRYAPGRDRGWLMTEAPLSEFHYERGVKVPSLFVARPTTDRLWSWLCRVWQESGYPGLPDLGLAAFGPTPISWHPDAAYAAPDSLLINFGGVQWGIDELPIIRRPRNAPRDGSRSTDPRQPVFHTLDAGEVVRFNCKHLHETLEPQKDRWSVVLWQISRFIRPMYQQYLAGQPQSWPNSGYSSQGRGR